MTRLRRALAATTAVTLGVGGFLLTGHATATAGSGASAAQSSVAAATTRIRGYVTDAATGDYLDDAFIVAWQGGRRVATALSYGDSGYELWVPPGRTIVTVMDEGYVHQDRTVDTRTGNKFGVDFDLARARYLSGYVLDETGDPVLDAEVSAWSGGEAVAGQLTYTDDDDNDGYFNLEVPKGTYKVVVDAGTKYYTLTRTGVSVTAGNSGVATDYVVRHKATVSGVVKDSEGKVKGARVTFAAVDADSPTSEKTAVTERDGSYATALAAGRYRVTVRSADHAVWHTGLTVDKGSNTLGATLERTTFGTEVTVKAGDYDPSKVSSRKPYKVVVKVLSEGRGTPAGRVTLTSFEGRESERLDDGVAVFRFSSLPRRGRTLTFSASYGGGERGDYTFESSTGSRTVHKD
ncbi:carboxypeptidase-like regulatory domain-containing protein [Nocardioides sp. GY 10127]|uniref:carboxypeptidase-like regulatory domain-containing protein n=1 Tax=Nocardioides sp. GY 10127 TaxID=2569762 RepID=UPI0010A93A99|nr:carboxypeptidase-like regulatory domain-containing protein [Nocardioides sp. GY 10127]TIC79385.1 carboxypeptidase regulatory-like domain-containing protein [Nocardioides sp. GY 10127]